MSPWVPKVAQARGRLTGGARTCDVKSVGMLGRLEVSCWKFQIASHGDSDMGGFGAGLSGMYSESLVESEVSLSSCSCCNFSFDDFEAQNLRCIKGV